MKDKEAIYSLSLTDFEYYCDHLFGLSISRALSRTGYPYFTYIAISEDGSVYKIGRSHNPIRRAKSFKGGYRAFNFKILYFIDHDIELELLSALDMSGAKTPLWVNPNGKRHREAFWLKKSDISYIVNKFGFKPISEFAPYGNG